MRIRGQRTVHYFRFLFWIALGLIMVVASNSVFAQLSDSYWFTDDNHYSRRYFETCEEAEAYDCVEWIADRAEGKVEVLHWEFDSWWNYDKDGGGDAPGKIQEQGWYFPATASFRGEHYRFVPATDESLGEPVSIRGRGRGRGRSRLA